jgi:hypothetical protein
MKKKVIRVGFDFDGVVAYNPFRVARAIVSFVKKNIFGVRKLKFWYPKNRLEQLYWIIVHESSAFPANGTKLMKMLAKEGEIEAHLITGRYSFLDHSLNRWLKRFRLFSCFTTINLNEKDEQPHLFKERKIKELKLNYFIEDNWDIVHYLEQRTKNKELSTKIYWIYNILDKGIECKNKFPYLGKALQSIVESGIMN